MRDDTIADFLDQLSARLPVPGAARPPAEVVRTALLLVSRAKDLWPAGNRSTITDVAATAEAAGAAAPWHRASPSLS
jgi:methenyltetrahydrofolate cyclohydrolase